MKVEEIMVSVLHPIILVIDIIAVIIILIGALKGLIAYLKKEEKAGLLIGHNLGLGLTFLMVGEALETLLVDDFRGLLLLAGILGVRAFIAFINHWEMENEKKH